MVGRGGILVGGEGKGSECVPGICSGAQNLLNLNVAPPFWDFLGSEGHEEV